jgi:hypothetical protein
MKWLSGVFNNLWSSTNSILAKIKNIWPDGFSARRMIANDAETIAGTYEVFDFTGTQLIVNGVILNVNNISGAAVVKVEVKYIYDGAGSPFFFAHAYVKAGETANIHVEFPQPYVIVDSGDIDFYLSANCDLAFCQITGDDV